MYAFHYLPMAFLLMLVFALQFGVMEQVKMKILLKRREDGYMAASIFIGNATREVTKNLSIELDVDTVIENPEKLAGARGFVRGEEILNIIPRTGWGAKEQAVRQKREKAADFLVVDGHWYIEIVSDNSANMRRIEGYQVKNYGDLWSNFWVSDDGKVFEGIGWDNCNYFNKGGFGPELLNIAFIKRGRDAAPSEAAIKAFKELVIAAICTKRLSLHYSVIPYYLLYDYHSLSTDSFERKEMREWDRYVDNVDFLFPVETDGNWNRPIVSRFEWRETEPKEGLMAIPSPVEYLVVKQFGGRCISNCTNHLKMIERAMAIHYGEKSNFFVAEDGRAYEAEGWVRTWDVNYRKKRAVEVTFLGSYFSYRPHKRMFSALTGLINEGLRSGKLSHEYKIVSRKTANPNLPWKGNILEEEIRKLDRYTEKF